MTLCTDTQLLAWEPNLPAEAAFAAQVLLGGSGALAGCTLTLASGSAQQSRVSAGDVVLLSGAVAGAFPIVRVDSDTQLSISALHADLEAAPVPVGTASGLGVMVRSFGYQRRLVSDMIQRAAGLEPSDPRPAGVLVQRQSLARACALGTLHLITSAMAVMSAEPAALWLRAEMYQRLFQRALRQSQAYIDTDGDGLPDVVRSLALVGYRRA